MTPGKPLFKRSVLLALGLLLLPETSSLAQGSLTGSGSKGSHQIWAAFDYSNSVTSYSTQGSSEGFRPQRTIAGDRTGLRRPAAVVTDVRGTLYVSNSGNNSVTVYAPEAAGNVAPIRKLIGPATGLASPQGTAIDSHGALYVANRSRDRVTVYAPDADGNVLPARSIWGSRTRLRSPESIAVDRHGALYVTGQSMGYILVFAPGANGNVRPVREIRSTAYGPVGMKSQVWRGVAFPHAMTFDQAGLLYVADWKGPSIEVYPSEARGITASLRTITGDNTALDYPIGLSIDSAGFVYVLNQSPDHSITVYAPGAVNDAQPVLKLEGDASGRKRPGPWDRAGQEPQDSVPAVPSAIAVYPAGAAGDAAPEKEISGARTGLHRPVTLRLADDGSVYVLNCQGQVTVYAPDAKGDVSPVRDFGRAPASEPISPTGLALDRSDTAFISFARYDESLRLGSTEVYAPGGGADSAPQRRIDFFAAKANGLAIDARDYLYAGLGENGFVIMHKSRDLSIPVGEVPEGPDADPSTPGWNPLLMLQGPDDELFRPGAFDIDSHRRLYVPNQDDAVRVYPSGKGGPLRPFRTIAGPRTGLDEPAAVALGPGDTLFVANVGSAQGSSVTVYPPNAGGNVAPIRSLRGPRTGLGRTGALVVDAAGRLHVLRKSPPGEPCRAEDS
jgi:sugar lactone lactonase YvrE